MVRIETGDAADAIADLDEALARKPDCDFVRSDRALAREKAGDLAGAEADLTDLIGEFPERVELLRQRERVRRLRGDTAGANRDRDALLASRPTSAVGWLARAWAQSDPTAALADLDAALKLDPDHRDTLQKKAEVLSERLNQPKDAIAVLTREIKEHPTAASALAGRAVLRARLGDRDGALADARAALKVAREPLVVYQAANTFALTSPKAPGDRREALKLLAEAFRRDPKLLDLVADDPDFAPIRNDPEFRALVEAARRVFK
jgi:tetratricopeptide (TPR) repeat protein